MKMYNWNTNWWIDGMSMLCFAHHFCRANSLSYPQFRRTFDNGEPASNTLCLLSGDHSSFDFERLLGGCNLDSSDAWRLFPTAFGVTDTHEQYADHLRFCRHCIDRGIHLSVHQLEWMVCCPVHLEPLQVACKCGARVPYTLTNKSKSSEALCKCDQLRFGDFSPFDQHEMEGLGYAQQTMRQLRKALRFGINQYRVSVGEAGNDELREQVGLTEAVLTKILAGSKFDHKSIGLHSCSIQLPYTGHQKWRDDQFGSFTRWAKANSDDRPELWSAALIAGVVEEEYFDADGLARIEHAIEDNGGRRRLRFADVPMLTNLLLKRVLAGLARGHQPVRTSLRPDIRIMFRMYGEPLCQIVWEEEATRLHGTAYWFESGGIPFDHGVPWIRALAEYLASKRFNHLRSSSKLAAIRQSRTLASLDDIFGGPSASNSPKPGLQLPLFDWLG